MTSKLKAIAHHNELFYQDKYKGSASIMKSVWIDQLRDTISKRQGIDEAELRKTGTDMSSVQDAIVELIKDNDYFAREWNKIPAPHYEYIEKQICRRIGKIIFKKKPVKPTIHKQQPTPSGNAISKRSKMMDPNPRVAVRYSNGDLADISMGDTIIIKWANGHKMEIQCKGESEIEVRAMGHLSDSMYTSPVTGNVLRVGVMPHRP